MSAACECLAMWLESEPCICNEPIGAPMEVSAKKLRDAERLVRRIQNMDRELVKLAKDKPRARTLIFTGISNNDPPPLELYLPPDIAAGLIRTMRFHALVELSKTGVTTTFSGHRPVVSA